MKPYDSKPYLSNALKTKKYFEIAKEFGVNECTIQRKMHKFGLTKKQHKWSKNEILLLTKNYGTNKKIFKLFPKRSKLSIYKKAHKLKIERPFKKRKYKLNNKFFEKWTKESSYILGWLYSDGNVSKDLRTFSLHLNKKDLDIVEKIRKALSSNQKIFIRGNYLEFRINCKQTGKTLYNLGCFPKKSKKIKFPKNMPKKFISHFVRGYFDGDGSIHFNKPNVIKIRIVGNKKFIQELKKIIENSKIKVSKIKKGVGCCGIEIYGDNARKFCFWIYSDSGHLYLKRKYLRYINHLRKRQLHE